MRALLDTHVFLWWITNDRRMSATAADLIRDKGNDLLLSAASAWEIGIKTQVGRLPLPGDPESFVPQQMILNRIRELPVSTAHALRVTKLPNHHRDPFDRLLVAQAIVEDIVLVTADGALKPYPVKIVW